MIDQYGLIVQENGDGGDTPCRCGVVLGYKQDLKLLANVVKNLMISPHVWIRHPVIYSNPKIFSRDQASRLMLGLGITGNWDLLFGYYNVLIHNMLRHPNGDILGLSEISALIRCWSFWPLYPLLLILDLQFFINITSWRWQPWDIDNLFIMDLWWAQKRFPTPWSWLACLLYDKEAAKNRIGNNLNSGTPGLTCKEAYEANMYFLETM